ncbi:ABC transporter substrate-binding protein [Streptomyces sp. NPDC094437]|uniref:ABC transporter substrate-binding protein n=1 Tax=Streptomyces sp. NPDC094437 TaxID=3366060 RepID=UPI003814953F
MSTPRPSRRAALLPGAVLTGALLLSACGSGGDSDPAGTRQTATATTRRITDAEGRKVDVPSTPKRIVALSEPTLDAALALGIDPVGATAGRGQRGVSTYLAGKAAKTQVVATVAAADLERVAALHPDLILLDETTGAKKNVAGLQKIAPTVVTAKLNEDWRTAFTDTADALGRKAAAQQWLTGFDTRVAGVKKGLGAAAGQSVSVVRWQGGAPSVVGRGDGVVGSTLTALGLHRPAAQQGTGSGHSEPVSLEKLDTIDADWLFFGTLGSRADGERAYAQARNVTNFSRLTAQKEGHVVVVQGSAWNSAGGPLAARIVLEDVEKALVK